MLELTFTIYESLGIGSPDDLAATLTMGALLLVSLGWLIRMGYQAQERILLSSHQCAALANAVPSLKQPQSVAGSFTWVDAKGRVFINVLPGELSALYTSSAANQADKLFEAYRGKWILTTFTIGDVERDDLPTGNSIMVLSDEQVRKPLIAAMFDLKWKSRLSSLRKGDPICIRGEISSGNSAYVGLLNCEPADLQGAESA